MKLRKTKLLALVLLMMMSLKGNAGSLDSTNITKKEKTKKNKTINKSVATFENKEDEDIDKPATKQNQKNYLPYVQVGGIRFFHVGDADLGGGGDLFIPIWQTHNQLFFTDARFYDRTGGVFEGNIHVGYRYLNPEEQRLYGIYGAFDRRRSGLGNYFNQLTLGGEYWNHNWFIGANVYKPIGETTRFGGFTEIEEIRKNGAALNPLSFLSK